MSIEPENHYWTVTANNPSTHVWSSASYSYVVLADATYQAWLARGNTRTSTIANETELRQVLAPYGRGLTAAETTIIQEYHHLVDKPWLAVKLSYILSWLLTESGTLTPTDVNALFDVVEATNPATFSLSGVGPNFIYRTENVAAAMLTGSKTAKIALTLPTTTQATEVGITLLGQGWKLHLSGNVAGTAWSNVRAVLTGTAPFSSVRIAHDGSNQFLLLGTTVTSWTSWGLIFWSEVVSDSGIFAAGLRSDDFSIEGISSEAGLTVTSTPTFHNVLDSINHVGTSGTKVPYLDGVNTWSAKQKVTVSASGENIIVDTPGASQASGMWLYTNAALKWQLYNDGATRFYIHDDTASFGAFLNDASSGWTTLSDVRLKKNIKLVPSVLDRLDRFRAVSFDWRSSGRTEVGVIAQEIVSAFPEVVVRGSAEAELPGQGNERLAGAWGVRYELLGALALQAVKELRKEVEELRGRVREVENLRPRP